VDGVWLVSICNCLRSRAESLKSQQTTQNTNKQSNEQTNANDHIIAFMQLIKCLSDLRTQKAGRQEISCL